MTYEFDLVYLTLGMTYYREKKMWLDEVEEFKILLDRLVERIDNLGETYSFNRWMLNKWRGNTEAKMDMFFGFVKGTVLEFVSDTHDEVHANPDLLERIFVDDELISKFEVLRDSIKSRLGER